jgi:isoleucyl-tRNA synthetase
MYNASHEEQALLAFWEKDQTFEKSVARKGTPYVFYDGPPFATGLPHYGHIVASTMKDIVPRYFTMRGFQVDRRWGWDCHGLPIENIIEKDLNLATKQEIEAFGIAKFNEACRSTVLKYAGEWKKTVRRMGRWVDMENDYKTMDPAFMESVWWVFKQLFDRDLIYKGHKVMHICPRCVTTLSNFEVTQGYKDVKDLSATAKFKLVPGAITKELFGHVAGPVYVLAWTTTPWTLPGNVLLALGHDIEYVLVSIEGEEGSFLLARARAELVLAGKQWKEIGRFKGAELAGMSYEPLFSYFKDTENAFRTVLADFVTTNDGTGVVHIAPAYGEDDSQVGQREKVPLVQHVSMDGRFIKEVADFAGQEVKPKDDATKTDVEIIKWLAHNGKLFSKQKIEHSYPHCWRCDTPLLNYATSSWFVRVTEMKEQLLKNNQSINWIPDHIKEGRFGKWLEGARDWAISRSRYWGTPLPVWEGDNGEVLCVGSIAELEALSGQKVTDLHKHLVDPITIVKDGVTYRRIPEVLDCWFESGSMPYGQMHYPFENKDKFEATFPAEFIAEGQDQTRGWFYTLHILATALTSGKKPAITSTKKSVPAFKHVIVNGIVLAEDGKKMSKRLKNYPEPDLILEKYGADAVRFYLASSPVMEAEALNFSEVGVREVYGKVVNTLANVLEFYTMFADGAPKKLAPKHVLDKWVLAKLQVLVRDVTQSVEAYKLADATRPISDFITEVSQWYVRRSRDRFKGDDQKDKEQALATLHEVLVTLSKVMAPFTPFIAEKVFQTVTGEKKSIHLEMWPEVSKKLMNEEVLAEMISARGVVELGLALRAEAGLKVRQVLSEFSIGMSKIERSNTNSDFSEGTLQMIADELNVKQATVGDTVPEGASWKRKESGPMVVALNTELTEELKREGLVREVIRTINNLRKEQKLTIEDKVVVVYDTADAELALLFKTAGDEIKKNVLAKELQAGKNTGAELEIDGRQVTITLQK